MLSLPALARLAERLVISDGPRAADDLIAKIAAVDLIDRDRAEAGVRLAVITGRLVLDREAVLRTRGADVPLTRAR